MLTSVRLVVRALPDHPMEHKARTDRSTSGPILLEPPPERAREVEGKLPWPVATLIGREREITAVCDLLRRDDIRLLTFTGPGGVGKTQLALAVAHELSDAFGDGVVFVSLAPLRDPALVAPAIAHEFDVRDSDSRLLLDRLQAALRERELLLVLDNFEHVTAAAPLVVDLLMACPQLKVLVTSREFLHLSGEHAFEVPPLDVPDATRSLPIDEIGSYDAIRLFVTRAQDAKTDFALTDANAEAVAEICRSLNGLPLALELAAARVRVLAPSDLLSQLTKRLQLLTGGHRDAPERLQTMRSAIAWSYDLLIPEEQRLFRRLAVFVGGFTLEAAEAVGADEAILDLLTSLVDKSLIQQPEQPNGQTRFSMLETIREFGLEQLAAHGEMEAVRDAHAAAFVELTVAPLSHLGDHEWLEGTDKVEADLANCHAALEWADSNDDAETVAHLAGALWRLEFTRGYPSDARRWLERALARRDDVSPVALIEVLIGAALFFNFQPEDESRAQALASELLAFAETHSDAYGAYCGHNYLGNLAMRRSDFAGATAHYRQALDLAPTTRNAAKQLAWGFCGLASIAFHQGDLAAAATGYSDALAHHREACDPIGVQYALVHLGRVRLAQGDIRDAASLLAESLAPSLDSHAKPGIAYPLVGLAMTAVATGQVGDAARLLGAVNVLRFRIGTLLEPEAIAEVAHATAEARRVLGDEAFASAWEAGQKMTLEEASQTAYAVAQTACAGAPASPADTTAQGLTSRELEVLQLLVEGLSDKEIAEALGITRRTASKHVETIRDKFAVPSRTAAATYATRHGLI